MDNYEIYHSLCSLKDLVLKYSEGKDVAEELSSLANQLSEQSYRVAVIGEFKRGKSSLVNAILGTEILPTDILPTTAVINRIIYDNNQKIVIYYKDGRIENSRIEELADYATKLDADKEKFAETIREIEVHYPFVFGNRSIELIDTPGLNDNEKMTSTTIEVLDKIDTAIVVISATMPLSETEQSLVCQLIEQKDIYHLAFAVTFIDRVSDDREDQDRVEELIRQRIKENTYEYFRSKHNDDPALMEKAHAILSEPKVFAVSSRLAMQGFIKGNNDLIEKSRFNHFKFQLVALLTANQELDVHSKTKRLSGFVEERVYEWNKNKITALEAEITANEEHAAFIEKAGPVWQSELETQLAEMDRLISDMGISQDASRTEAIEAETNLKRIFIKHLASITESSYNVDSVIEVLDKASQECCKAMSNYGAVLHEWILRETEKIEKWTLDRSALCGLDSNDFKAALDKWRNSQTFPVFVLTNDSIIEYVGNILGELMPSITLAVKDAFSEYQRDITAYIAAWRTILLKNNSRERLIINDILANAGSNSAELTEKKLRLEDIARRDLERVRSIRESINNAI